MTSTGDQWESHRDTLRILYLVENKTLKQVKEYMVKTYGFVATEWQFENKLQREWGFTKKLKKQDWRAIDYHIKMRTQNEGKDTIVVTNSGTPLSSRKLRKELSRYCKVSIAGNTVHENTPRLPKGVILRTPPPQSPVLRPLIQAKGRRTSEIQLLGCENDLISQPMLLAEEMDVESIEDFITSLDDSLGLENQTSGVIISPEQRTVSDDIAWDDFMTDDINTTAVDGGNLLLIPGGRHFQVLYNIPWFRFLGCAESSGIFDDWDAPKYISLASTSESVAESNRIRLTFQMISMLQTLVPERYEGENSKLLLEPSNKFLITELLRTGTFLLANNMATEDSQYSFIYWVFEQKSPQILRPFLKLKLPTVQSISARLLSAAVWSSSTNAFRFVIEAGIDESLLTGRRGHNYLFLAVMKNNIDIVRTLLLRGAHVDPDNFGDIENCPMSLESSAWNGNAEMLRLLFIAGATPSRRWNISYNNLNYLLEQAVDAYSGQADCVLFLIEQGADVDASWDLDHTCGELSILDYAYIAKGADLYISLLPSSKKSTTTFTVSGTIHAANRGEKEFLAYSSSPARAHDPNRQMVLESALFYAVTMEDHQAAQNVLLRAGVDPNVSYWTIISRSQESKMRSFHITQPNKHKLNMDSPLEHAVRTGDYELLECLVEHGADIKRGGVLTVAATCSGGMLSYIISQGGDVESSGKDALLSAIREKQINNCEVLVKAGVDVNEGYPGSNNYLQTPLMEAVCGGNLEIARYLIQNGAKVSYSEFPGFVDLLLIKAIHTTDAKMLELILSAGADSELRSSSSRDWFAIPLGPVKFVQENAAKLLDMFHILLKFGAPVRRASAILVFAVSFSTDTASIQHLLDLGLDVNQSHGNWSPAKTPLQAAAFLQNLDVLKQLLNAGADVNSPADPSGGRTALQAVCCCEAPRMEVINFLLDTGADVNASPAEHGGFTALQAAAIQGHIKVALRLLDAGADVNADGSQGDGCTALEGAAENGRLDMVQILLNAGATNGLDSAIKKTESGPHFAVADLLKDHLRFKK